MRILSSQNSSTTAERLIASESSVSEKSSLLKALLKTVPGHSVAKTMLNKIDLH